MKKIIYILILNLVVFFSLNVKASTSNPELWPGFSTASSDWNIIYDEFGRYIFNKISYPFYQKYPIDTASHDYYNADNMALIYIEMKLLADYITTHDVETLKNFLAVRQFRNEKILNNADTIYETGTDIFPGVIEYVASKGTQRSEEEFPGKFKQCILPLDNFKLQSGIVKDCIDYSPREYTSVLAGYELDKIDPEGNWKNTVDNNLVSAVELLQDHFQKFSEQELNARVNQAKTTYNYDVLVKELPKI